MIIYKEKKADNRLKEISFLYSRLGLLFSEVAKAFLDWSCLQEGLLLEIEKSPLEQAKTALNQINTTLANLNNIDRKYRFDKRDLHDQYCDELELCQISVERMVTALNIIWKSGKPSKREIPFGDSTNYKFIIKCLTKYKDIANGVSKSINKKAAVFNKANKDLPPLPKIPDNMTAPAWARNI